MRKTKIICTIGPATCGIDNLVKLIESGMDAARLNFSHGTHEEHLQTIKNIREAEKSTGKPIAILQDLQGPKIRTGKVENGAVALEDDSEFIITIDNIEFGNGNKVSTVYENLPHELSTGNTVLLDDGYIILKVKKVEGNNIFTEVVKGGILKDNKGIVAPGVSSMAPSLSQKDLDDLKFGLESGVDAVALSFVRSERDILELKTAMKIYGRAVPVISKIERIEGYENIDNIIKESESIMVARGDLGLEMPAEEVPIVQKEIIRKCNFHGRPVITATQMLESMINNPRPTRAEASDVANAVIDGSDCVMLSAETSIGKYPFDAVEYMDKIIRAVETKYYRKSGELEIPSDMKQNISDAFGKASVVIAEQINAAAIVAYTSSGYTAKNIAKYRPSKPVIVLTDNVHIQRRMESFVWGVKAICIPPDFSHENIFEQFSDIVKHLDFVNSGDYIVFVAGLTAGKIMPENIIKVHKV
ncbi:pyruvate kinase [Bacteroidota bacterium]